VLYDPNAFEPLSETAWDERLVREAIREIVADADAACRRKLLWPAHEWDGWQSPKPLKTLYVGAAGVLWALDRLRERGYGETGPHLAGVARRAEIVAGRRAQRQQWENQLRKPVALFQVRVAGQNEAVDAERHVLPDAGSDRLRVADEGRLDLADLSRRARRLLEASAKQPDTQKLF